jgi:hypothetical protein
MRAAGAEGPGGAPAGAAGTVRATAVRAPADGIARQGPPTPRGAP